jgi:hypothetical protein
MSSKSDLVLELRLSCYLQELRRVYDAYSSINSPERIAHTISIMDMYAADPRWFRFHCSACGSLHYIVCTYVCSLAERVTPHPPRSWFTVSDHTADESRSAVNLWHSDGNKGRVKHRAFKFPQNTVPTHYAQTWAVAEGRMSTMCMQEGGAVAASRGSYLIGSPHHSGVS